MRERSGLLAQRVAVARVQARLWGLVALATIAAAFAVAGWMSGGIASAADLPGGLPFGTDGPAQAAPGVTVNPSTVFVTEGGAAATYTVVLNAQPTSGVIVTMNHNSQVTATGPGGESSLFFTQANWNVPQTVSVRAVLDAFTEGNHATAIRHTATGGGYFGVMPPNVAVNITDAVSPVGVTKSKTALSVSEAGASDSYTLRLNSQPSGTVTISLGTTPGGQILTSPSVLTFTPSNWNSPQAVVVQAVNDSVAEGSHLAQVVHAVAGGAFTGVSVGNVTVNIQDNDGTTAPGLILSKDVVNVTEGGATDTYTVRLASRPTGTVEVDLDTTPGNQVRARRDGTNQSTLFFTTSNWNSPQTVRVTALNDGIVEGVHLATVRHDPSGGGYGGVDSVDIAVVITDNNSKAIVLSDHSVTVREGGETDTYTVRLSQQPTANVTVLLTVSPSSQATALSTASNLTVLTFTTGNWNTPQTVRVTANNDSAVEGNHQATVQHTAIGGGYDGVAVQRVTVSIRDNDGPTSPVVGQPDECHDLRRHPSLRGLCEAFDQVPAHVRPIIARLIERHADQLDRGNDRDEWSTRVRLADGEARTFDAGPAGTVRLRRDGGDLDVVAVNARSGWSFDIDADDDEVKIEFRRNGGEVEFEAELDDGRVRVKVKVDD